MTRQSKSSILARLATLALVVACAAVAASPQARGAAPTIAVTQFTNDAGAPQSTVDLLGKAAYDALGQGGKYTPVGGGALKVQSWWGGDLIVSALDAAKNVGAQEIITTDLVSASGQSVTYRMSAYRVDPLAFIRSGTFTQNSLSPEALTAGFATNLATLHAPRIALGSIYSLDGPKADFGEASGANLGDMYNVVRGGQKVAQAKITAMDLNTATLEIMNASPGYQPRVGDGLVGVGPQPPLPPAAHTSANTFTILGLLVATGAALLGVGSSHNGATISSTPAPSPTSSSSAFTVSGSASGVSPSPVTFTFTFSQPVDIALINFTNTSSVYYSATNPTVPNSPLTSLGGGTPVWSAGNTVLTVTGMSPPLVPNQTITFTFLSTIKSTTGVFLATTALATTVSAARAPLTLRGSHPLPPPHGGVLIAPPKVGGPHPQPPGSNPKGTPNHNPHNPN